MRSATRKRFRGPPPTGSEGRSLSFYLHGGCAPRSRYFFMADQPRGCDPPYLYLLLPPWWVRPAAMLLHYGSPTARMRPTLPHTHPSLHSLRVLCVLCVSTLLRPRDPAPHRIPVFSPEKPIPPARRANNGTDCYYFLPTTFWRSSVRLADGYLECLISNSRRRSLPA